MKTSKSRDENEARNIPIEINDLCSMSSEAKLSNNAQLSQQYLMPSITPTEAELLSARSSIVKKGINDFEKGKPTSNIEILKHLTKSNLADSDSGDDEKSDNSDDSFRMQSRKREYDQQIGSSKLISHLII